jgi:hypothetical protein
MYLPPVLSFYQYQAEDFGTLIQLDQNFEELSFFYSRVPN